MLDAAADGIRGTDEQARILLFNRACELLIGYDAALAHELNQPITALTLYLQSVRKVTLGQTDGAGLPPRAMMMLEKALHEVERAGLIMQRMRRRDAVGTYNAQLMDINVLIDDAVELTLLGRLPATGIACRLAKDLPAVLIDPVQIQQIVVNLARNALDAVRDQAEPEVRVRTCLAGGTVRLTVKDNGPGIPAHVLPHLFVPFATSKSNGLGLGLVISRAIARRHGGDLTVKPRAQGKGVTFALHLPIPALPPMAA